MAHTDDYYGVLGVARDAGAPEIRRATGASQANTTRTETPRVTAPNGSVRSPKRTLFSTTQPAAPATTAPSNPARGETPPPATPAVPTRRGVLELSAREARLSAIMPLTLTTANGTTIVLPAGLADGDQIAIAVPDGRAVLTVRLNEA